MTEQEIKEILDTHVDIKIGVYHKAISMWEFDKLAHELHEKLKPATQPEKEVREKMLVDGLARIASNLGNGSFRPSKEADIEDRFRVEATETLHKAGYTYHEYPEVPPDKDGWFSKDQLLALYGWHELEKVEPERCGAYAENWMELEKPKGWKGCSLPKGHEGNHRCDDESATPVVSEPAPEKIREEVAKLVKATWADGGTGAEETARNIHSLYAPPLVEAEQGAKKKLIKDGWKSPEEVEQVKIRIFKQTAKELNRANNEKLAEAEQSAKEKLKSAGWKSPKECEFCQAVNGDTLEERVEQAKAEVSQNLTAYYKESLDNVITSIEKDIAGAEQKGRREVIEKIDKMLSNKESSETGKLWGIQSYIEAIKEGK